MERRHWRPEKERFVSRKKPGDQKRSPKNLKKESSGDQKKEALETRKKALVCRKKPGDLKKKALETRKKEALVSVKKPEVWKGGSESKAVEYGANRQTLYPSARNGDWKGRPAWRQEERKPWCLKRSQKSGKEALKLKL